MNVISFLISAVKPHIHLQNWLFKWLFILAFDCLFDCLWALFLVTPTLLKHPLQGFRKSVFKPFSGILRNFGKIKKVVKKTTFFGAGDRTWTGTEY